MLHKICTENEATTAEHVVVDPYDLPVVWQQVSRQTGSRQCVGTYSDEYVPTHANRTSMYLRTQLGTCVAT
jgi:hypothetical protein